MNDALAVAMVMIFAICLMIAFHLGVAGLVCGVWAVLILFGMAVTRRKIKRGVCLICGYDLRATPHRCPECGTIPGSRRR